MFEKYNLSSLLRNKINSNIYIILIKYYYTLIKRKHEIVKNGESIYLQYNIYKKLSTYIHIK